MDKPGVLLLRGNSTSCAGSAGRGFETERRQDLESRGLKDVRSLAIYPRSSNNGIHGPASEAVTATAPAEAGAPPCLR